jgi:hypothetical protein
MLGMMEGGGYMGSAAPVVNDGVKEALKIVFSKDGSYAQVRGRDTLRSAKELSHACLSYCPLKVLQIHTFTHCTMLPLRT